jgi:hypothetical protein
MDTAHREYLVKLFDLRDTPQAAPPGERLFIWNFAISRKFRMKQGGLLLVVL